ncbi:hypothetical protein HMPREF9141_2783 [Prevotella multiformis DSM 16608]|uniref:Uncharacterized protein n=1 Tax=Prevotella multiformis DSM 16608 TaxID=888743 RepID=F0FB16_9BACT|nr:hypothetical protein HMPREF9141_2783 [Prevotella multiformis DSM 16608]
MCRKFRLHRIVPAIVPAIAFSHVPDKPHGLTGRMKHGNTIPNRLGMVFPTAGTSIPDGREHHSQLTKSNRLLLRSRHDEKIQHCPAVAGRF